MKELSIEEKAKRYDEAIERAKEISNEQKAQPFDVMLKVFPELKESEDERIRKELIRFVNFFYGCHLAFSPLVSKEELIAWLEMQGETSPVLSNSSNIGKVEQKPSWSEEDEKMLKDILVDVKFNGYNNDMQAQSYKKMAWLKSLRPQKQWKPSEEQIKILNEVLSFAANHESPYWNDYIFGTLSYLIRQLKKLRGK